MRCPRCGFNAAPNDKKMETLYAWLSVDPKTGNEGVIAMRMGAEQVYMAMVNSNKEPLLKIENHVKHGMQGTEMGYCLAEFKRVQ